MVLRDKKKKTADWLFHSKSYDASMKTRLRQVCMWIKYLKEFCFPYLIIIQGIGMGLEDLIFLYTALYEPYIPNLILQQLYLYIQFDHNPLQNYCSTCIHMFKYIFNPNYQMRGKKKKTIYIHGMDQTQI